jgi:hypothetical protein
VDYKEDEEVLLEWEEAEAAADVVQEVVVEVVQIQVLLRQGVQEAEVDIPIVRPPHVHNCNVWPPLEPLLEDPLIRIT